MEDTSEAISEAKDVLRETYRDFNDLRQQVFELSRLLSQDRPLLFSVENFSRSNAKEFLSDVAFSEEEPSSCRKQLAFVLTFLEGQIEIARKICYQATCTLHETSKHVAATNKHKKLYKSMKMQIAVNEIVWRLLNRDSPFMLAEIQRVYFKRF